VLVKSSPTRAGRHRQRRAGAAGDDKYSLDLYLKPLLIGADPWDNRIPLAAHVPAHDGVRRKGIGMTAMTRWTFALWDLLGKSAKQPVYRLLGGAPKPAYSVYASRAHARRWMNWPAKAKRYKDEGYGTEAAMKPAALGWGTGSTATCGNAEKCRACPHRAPDCRRRHRHHDRRQ